MNTDDEERIDRDAWRRRLADAGAPPLTTDFVIRAEARRVLAPRTSRWWLPASLAAAVVLAVLIAQLQVEDERMHPLIDESQIPRPQPEPAPALDTALPEFAITAESPAETDTVAGAPAATEPPAENFYVPPASVELPDGELVRERAAEPLPEPKADNAAPAPAASPPPADREERALENIAVTGSRIARQEAGAARREPEEWYAEIEELRAEGRDAEAEEELQKLEAAYPGWLEKRQEAQP